MAAPPPKKPTESWQASLRDASPYIGLGMQIALGLVFFMAVGYGLDRWLGTLPWFTLAGSLVGMVAIFIYLFRASQTLGRQSDARRREGES